jgi:hypothetical protein
MKVLNFISIIILIIIIVIIIHVSLCCSEFSHSMFQNMTDFNFALLS